MRDRGPGIARRRPRARLRPLLPRRRGARPARLRARAWRSCARWPRRTAARVARRGRRRRRRAAAPAPAGPLSKSLGSAEGALMPARLDWGHDRHPPPRRRRSRRPPRSPPAAATTRSPTSRRHEQAKIRKAMLDFARCMREHGVDMPDPKFDGDGGVMMQVGGPASAVAEQDAARPRRRARSTGRRSSRRELSEEQQAEFRKARAGQRALHARARDRHPRPAVRRQRRRADPDRQRRASTRTTAKFKAAQKACREVARSARADRRHEGDEMKRLARRRRRRGGARRRGGVLVAGGDEPSRAAPRRRAPPRATAAVERRDLVDRESARRHARLRRRRARSPPASPAR